MKHSSLLCIPILGLCLPLDLQAQNSPPEKDHLDKILERPRTPPFTADEEAALDLTSDSAVDVRDLVVLLNGLPVSAYFETAQSVAFREDSSVPVVVRFSKPATGTIRFSLGGTASAGEDFLAFEDTVTGFEGLTTSLNVSEALSHTLIVPIAPSVGEFASERRLTLNLMAQATVTQGSGSVTVNRTGGISPGYRSSHTIVIRDTAKSWTGTMEFGPEAGLSAMDVRFLMDGDGTTRMLIPDSVVFAAASSFVSSQAGNGRLVFSSPISGVFSLPGETSQVSWTLTLTDAASDPEDPLSVASYQGTFTLPDFPVSRVTKSSAVTLVLTSEN
jgi:hypothetical protein